jgi:hypothetical protein
MDIHPDGYVFELSSTSDYVVCHPDDDLISTVGANRRVPFFRPGAVFTQS